MQSNTRRNLLASPSKQRVTPQSPTKRTHRNDSSSVEAVLKFTSPTKAGSRGSMRTFAPLPTFNRDQTGCEAVRRAMYDAKVLVSPGTSAVLPLVLQAGHGSVQGRRPTMEDTHCIHLGPARGSQRDVVGICAVFDGHCGKDVADIACRLFPEIVFTHQLFGNDNVRTLVEALIETDKAIHTQLRGSDGGSTHISSLVFNNMLFVIGLGDARAVLCDNGSAICMSRDHKPSDPDERRRVLAAGGTVQWERVGGCLAVSRALGDWEFKFSGPTYPDNTHFPVSNIGEVTQINITDTTEFLILACDGLWDVVSNEEAVRFVSEALRKAPKAADATGRVRTLNNISLALANYALEKRSMDNVTVVIQTFH